MIGCQVAGCEWQGFVSELGQHEFIEHDLGNWGGPDCEKCGGNGEIVTRVAAWNGDEQWFPCTACRGRGTV